MISVDVLDFMITHLFAVCYSSVTAYTHVAARPTEHTFAHFVRALITYIMFPSDGTELNTSAKLCFHFPFPAGDFSALHIQYSCVYDGSCPRLSCNDTTVNWLTVRAGRDGDI